MLLVEQGRSHDRGWVEKMLTKPLCYMREEMGIRAHQERDRSCHLRHELFLQLANMIPMDKAIKKYRSSERNKDRRQSQLPVPLLLGHKADLPQI
jgi:hypothetical protein